MSLKLSKKVFIKAVIKVLTGLHIGGSKTGLKIGGIDTPVIVDSEDKPYIPGSSLKGKLLSLIEKAEGLEPHKGKQRHLCEDEGNYKDCLICQLWGILPNDNISIPTPTRLIARDSYLIESSLEPLKDNLELEWTESKVETAIDRGKGTALHGSLREIERVPKGAEFSSEFIVDIYEGDKEKELISKVVKALQLLEDDYLGGMGSRGYGRIRFKDIKLYEKKYFNGDISSNQKIEAKTLDEFVKKINEI